MEQLKNNIPLWLQIPINYYQTTGKNFRFEIFRHVSKDKINEKYINLVSIILNLFQLSIIMLDDIFDKTITRRDQPSMHIIHGTTLVSAWAIGISHYIYQIISDNFLDESLSIKFNKLYNEVGIRTLRGQCYELTIKDYKEIVKFKTSYYTVCFPIAIYVLLKTGDLDKAMEIMEDEDLLDLGFLFQAENDFNGNFEKDNTDIEMKSWTILIDMVSKKIGSTSTTTFSYPETKEKANELFQKYNILNEYVTFRENGLEILRKRIIEFKSFPKDDKDGILEAKYGAIEFCLAFFEGYKYTGYIPPFNGDTAVVTSASAAELTSEVKHMSVK